MTFPTNFLCVWSLYYIGTLPVHFCTEICSAFFDGTCSFFYFFEWNWNFFLFLPIGRFSAPAKTNKQVLVPFEKVNKQESVPAKKSCTGFLYRKCTGNVPIVQIAVERKPLNFERRSTYFDNILQKLEGKNNNIFKAKNWTIFQSTIFEAKTWAYRYFKITKKREKINQYWKKKFLKQRRKKKHTKATKKKHLPRGFF